MKIVLHVSNKLSIEEEVKNDKEAFEKLSHFQELFEQYCPIKGSQTTKFRVRTVTKDKKEYKYYELWCPETKARLSFGVHQTGDTLFPKKKDEDGKYLPDGGWVVWTPDAKDE